MRENEIIHLHVITNYVTFLDFNMKVKHVNPEYKIFMLPCFQDLTTDKLCHIGSSENWTLWKEEYGIYVAKKRSNTNWMQAMEEIYYAKKFWLGNENKWSRTDLSPACSVIWNSRR